MEPYVIREGSLADFPSMFRLLQDMVSEEHLQEDFTNSENGLRDDFISGHYNFFIVEATSTEQVDPGKVPIGCMLYSVTYEYVVGPTLFFQRYLKTDYRGTDVEKDLINEARKVASDARVKNLLTFTSTGSAPPMTVLVAHDVFGMTFDPAKVQGTADLTTDNYAVREGHQEDLSEIHDLLTELAVMEKIDGEFTVSKDEFCAAGDDDRYLFRTVVLEYRSVNQSPKIVGCIVVSRFYNFLKGETYFLQGLYIQPNYRGKGNGSRMVRSILQIFQAKGGNEFMFMIQRGNAQSQALFKRFGATNRTLSEKGEAWMFFNEI
ncbi:uncharacterized protein [Diadema antillarum]|uniref:uncharacterized protein isoform X1 n=1 Tax=Diadema antillarum TaxID=105358 RepID=UPI003A8A7A03